MALMSCTSRDKGAGTQDKLEITVRKFEDFYEELLIAASSTTDIEFSEFGGEMRKTYDVVAILREPTESM